MKKFIKYFLPVLVIVFYTNLIPVHASEATTDTTIDAPYNTNSYMHWVWSLMADPDFPTYEIPVSSIPISYTGDGSDTDGVVVTVGSKIYIDSTEIYGEDIAIRMFANGEWEGDYAYALDTYPYYVVGLGEVSNLYTTDKELASNFQYRNELRQKSILEEMDTYKTLTGNCNLGFWKAYLRKYANSDNLFVYLEPVL